VIFVLEGINLRGGEAGVGEHSILDDPLASCVSERVC
jgi:hypothetical protein